MSVRRISDGSVETSEALNLRSRAASVLPVVSTCPSTSSDTKILRARGARVTWGTGTGVNVLQAPKEIATRPSSQALDDMAPATARAFGRSRHFIDSPLTAQVRPPQSASFSRRGAGRYR